MHASLNCDQVFDVLTQGPFPRGESDDIHVEMHLRCCHECRCLAEALRPAVGVLHESLNDFETPSLPGYSGQLAADSNIVDRVLARIDDGVSPQRADASFAIVPWAVSVVVVLCICLTLTGLLWGVGDPRATTAAAEIQGANPSSKDLHALAHATAPSCLLPASEATDAYGRYQCCTYCHTANNPRTPYVEAAAVLQGQLCMACHASP